MVFNPAEGRPPLMDHELDRLRMTISAVLAAHSELAEIQLHPGPGGTLAVRDLLRALDEFAHLRRMHVDLVVAAGRVSSELETIATESRAANDALKALQETARRTIPGQIIAPVRG